MDYPDKPGNDEMKGLNMEWMYSVIGLLGAVAVVGVYLAVQAGNWQAGTVGFYWVNLVAAFLVMVSSLYIFDGGDVGAIALEIAWMVISAMGIQRLLNEKGAA